MNNGRRPSKDFSVMTVGTVLLCCGVLWGCSEKNNSQTEPAASAVEQGLPSSSVSSPTQTTPTSSTEAKTIVPQVVGMRWEDATTSLQSAQLLPQMTEQTVPGVAAGQVVGQDPEAGVSVAENSTVALQVAAMAVPQVSDPELFYVVARHSGKCLHQHGGTLGNGDRITQWDCVNQPNVKLREVPAGDGYIFLKFEHSGKCVHQHGATRGNGDPITQWDCVDQGNVKLQKVAASDGYFFLKFAHSGKCVHQQGATHGNGDPITQWDCVNQPNVQWKFRPAPS